MFHTVVLVFKKIWSFDFHKYPFVSFLLFSPCAHFHNSTGHITAMEVRVEQIIGNQIVLSAPAFSYVYRSQGKTIDGKRQTVVHIAADAYYTLTIEPSEQPKNFDGIWACGLEC